MCPQERFDTPDTNPSDNYNEKSPRVSSAHLNTLNYDCCDFWLALCQNKRIEKFDALFDFNTVFDERQQFRDVARHIG